MIRMYIVPIDDEEPDFNELFIGNIRKEKELIRCKDCKHKIINENVPRRPIICCRTLMVGETKPNWFCADGERQEDG